jgi:SepF-like predicted cell division protein (DUF552 family)
MVETTSDINNGKIEIYNVNGKKIVEQTIFKTINQLNLNALSLGIYIIKISNNEQLITERKIVIMR